MRNRFDLVWATGAAITLALIAGGCALADEGDEAKVQEGATEAFEFAPEVVDPPQSKEVEDDGLTEKGAVSRQRGAIAHIPLTISGTADLVCETSNNTWDPVLALVRCEGNVHCWPYDEVTWEGQQKITTLALNDDYSGLNSKVTYNPGNWEQNIYVLGFAYGNSVGTADITCKVGSTVVASGNYSFRGGSAKDYSCTGGSAITTGGGDPMMIGIDSVIGGGSGRMNDDIDYCPSGCNRESHLLDLSGTAMWYVFNGYNEGTTTLNCP